MSVYRTAIDLTTQAIDNRARYFRNQIVSVVMLGVVSIVAAAYAWTFWPLVFLLLIVPICGFFFLLDGRLLGNWRSQLLASWARRELDLWPFRDAMEAIPSLPKTTLQGMLQSLPSALDWSMEQAASSKTREVVAAIYRTVHACRRDTMALKVAGTLIIAISIVAAVVSKESLPLLFVLVVSALPLMATALKQWRQAKLNVSLSGLAVDTEFDKMQIKYYAESLDWHPISNSEKSALLKVM